MTSKSASVVIHAKSNAKPIKTCRPRQGPARSFKWALNFSTAGPGHRLSLCPVFTVRTPGVFRPVPPAPCSAGKKTASSLWTTICVWGAKPVFPPAPGGRPSGIRKLAKWSNVITAWTVLMQGLSRPVSRSVPLTVCNSAKQKICRWSSASGMPRPWRLPKGRRTWNNKTGSKVQGSPFRVGLLL